MDQGYREIGHGRSVTSGYDNHADPAALRGLAEARESEQAGDVVYGAEAARALLAERKR